MTPLQSVVDAAGPHAQSIENLWWFFLALLGAVFVIVMTNYRHQLWYRTGDRAGSCASGASRVRDNARSRARRRADRYRIA